MVGKYMMRKLLLFNILVFCSLALLAKDGVYHISWSHSGSGFSFEDASFDPNYPGLPVWLKTIAADVHAARLNLEVLEVEELKGQVDSLIAIPDNFQFNYDLVQARGQSLLRVQLIPLRRGPNGIQRLKSFSLKHIAESSIKSGFLSANVKQNSVLAAGNWVKVRTTSRGIHKISESDLRSWGFNHPENVRVYGNGGYRLPQMNKDEVPDDLTQLPTRWANDNSEKYGLYFYSVGNVKWRYDARTATYSHDLNEFARGSSYYFLTEDVGAEMSILNRPSETIEANREAMGYDHLLLYEEERYNLIESGSQWFGYSFLGEDSQTFSFHSPDKIPGSSTKLSVQAAGRSKSNITMEIQLNNEAVGHFVFKPYQTYESADFADIQNKDFIAQADGDLLDVTLTTSGTGTLQAWVDYILAHNRCMLDKGAVPLQFRDAETVADGAVTRFSISGATPDMEIWDVTDGKISTSIPFIMAGSVAQFVVSTESLHEFVAFTVNDDIPEVEFVEQVSNQNLHGLASAEMLIVTHPAFYNEAVRLAEFHQKEDGLNVATVLVDDIYNEFGSGIADVSAIRNFVRNCYQKWNGSLKYLLLFGGGTYDNLHDLSDENPAFIPTWQSENSINPAISLVSDDFFGLLDENEGGYTGAIDIGVGRIPCRNGYEAKTAVDKIIHYVSPECLGDWRNDICFIADDEDSNLHVRDAERLANQVNASYPSFNTDKIYFDAYPQETSPIERYPSVTEAIDERVKRGVLILNYTGHANEDGLAHEKVLLKTDIDAWSNYNNMPVFVTATCEFSRYDMCEKNSAGEHILFNPQGGGIALFSTTRLVYSSSNYLINKNFFNHVFEQDESGDNLRMGDIIRLAKNESGGTINARKFALLGDPALQLKYPKYRVKTEKINEQDASVFNDTIHALDVVSIEGRVQDISGAVLNNYNGRLVAVVYDKETTDKTLGNGGEVPFEFVIRKNIIYKGTVEVTAGEFQFSFVVPKDINYRIDKGLIRYYADNGLEDAKGFYEQFNVGGGSGSAISDNAGPVIDLYLDNEGFRSGGETHANPLLIAKISDDTGINTSGVGIGHDMTVVLDNNEQQVLVLNEFFQSAPNAYQSGVLSYQLQDLTDGHHTLRLKAWDVVNNSTEVEIDFWVTDRFYIHDLFNYPNPMHNATNFKFEHNRYDEMLQVRIAIYDRQGRLIDIIEKDISSIGFKSSPINWSPGSKGIALAAGLYIYQFTVATQDGNVAEESGRILLIR